MPGRDDKPTPRDTTLEDQAHMCAAMLRSLSGQWRARLDAGHLGTHAPADVAALMKDLDAAAGMLEPRVRGYAEVTRDLTERRAAAQAMSQSEQRLRLLVESLEDHAVFMLDPSGRVLTWNAGAQRIKGYTANEIIGQHFSRFFTPEDLATDKPARALHTAATTGRYAEEGWRVRKNGARFWANVVLSAIHDAQGVLVAFSKVTRDFTERHEAEERLRQSEERFRLLVESVEQYAIFMLDPSGHVASWNRGAERLKGYTAKEIVGQHFSRFYTPGDIAADKPGTELRVALAEGRYEEEGWRVRKNGTRFWASVVITRVCDEKGTHVGFAKVTRDFTERRASEESLRIANEELEAFSYTVSHDIRAPLRTISSFARILEESLGDRLGDEERNYVLRMRTATTRITHLVEDLLLLSKVTRGQVSTSEVDLAAIAREVIDELHVRDPERRVSFKAPEELLVQGDPLLLRNVLDNLLGNAWKFTQKVPRARIELGVDPGSSPQVLFVRDNGAGFDMEQVTRLFRPFQRLHDPAEFEGNGIGLASVRRIILKHGGDIWADSKPGGGATFWFTLSRAADDPPT